MNTRGRGEPMHHKPITISKGDPYVSSSNPADNITTKGRTTQNRANQCEFFFSQFRNNFKVAPAHSAVAVAARVLAIFTVNRPVIP